MKITKTKLRQIIKEEFSKARKSNIKKNRSSKKRIKESGPIKLGSLLREDKSREKFLNQRVKNPETGREIKIKSALTYPKNSPAYKAAKKAANNYFGDEDKGSGSDQSKSSGESKEVQVTQRPATGGRVAEESYTDNTVRLYPSGDGGDDYLEDFYEESSTSGYGEVVTLPDGSIIARKDEFDEYVSNNPASGDSGGEPQVSTQTRQEPPRQRVSDNFDAQEIEDGVVRVYPTTDDGEFEVDDILSHVEYSGTGESIFVPEDESVIMSKSDFEDYMQNN